MRRTDYPFCPHGTYVGGCGADFMCGACELGDAEPSPAEQREYVRRLYSKMFDPEFGVTSAIPAFLSLPSFAKASYVWNFMFTQRLNELRREQAFLQEILRYARDENDTQWIWRRHGERRAEWDMQSGEDQFASLPDYVLDGA